MADKLHRLSDVIGNTDKIGTYQYAENASGVNIASGTATPLTSMTIASGVWLLIGSVRFTANSSGYRRANITTTSGAEDINVGVAAAPSGGTNLQVVRIYTVSTDTILYLNAMQNSGSTLTCESTLAKLWAVQIR